MNTLSAILWNPDIEIFSIFGISIRYYSVLFVTGLSLAYWVIYKLYQDQKIPYEKFDSLFVYCLLGIVIGARLGHCLFVSIRPRACFFPLFSFLPLWLHYNLNPLCVQY